MLDKDSLSLIPYTYIMKRYLAVIAILVGCIILFAFNLGDLSLLKGDENYYFSSARRMIREGDFITPRYHHHIRYEKPVLFYWIVAGLFKIMGVGWITARMASVIFGALTVLITYLLARCLFDERRARLSAIILATSFLFFQYARLAVIDMTFLFLVTSSLYLFIKSDIEGGRDYLLLAFIPLGLSILAKGPLGAVVVAMTLFAYMVTTRRYYMLTNTNSLAGILLLFAIALPWPFLMVRIHGQAFLNHIWNVEALDKTVGSLLKLKSASSPLWLIVKHLGYYIPVVIFVFVPWSLVLVPAILKRHRERRDNGRVFILGWFWVVFGFFTIISFKHTHYMLLLAPPMAIIVADYLSKKKGVAMIAMATILVYIASVGYILPEYSNETLKSFSLRLAPLVRLDEELGIASKGFNLKKLGIHLNNLVSTPYELGADDLIQYRRVKTSEVVPFLESDKRVYLLITMKDYCRFVPRDLRRQVHILEKSRTWKRFDSRDLFYSVLSLNLEGLKEEAYLISNRR